ncbi:class I SAM-dependent methyltransferase [Patescibacteria group bacterium]
MVNSSSKKLIEVACNLCSRNQFKPFFTTYSNHGSQVSFSATSQAVSGEQIVKCKSCGLVFVNPRVNGKEIIDQYSSKAEKDYIKDASGRTASFRRSVKMVKKFQNFGKILDIGCAAGFFLKAAEEEGFRAYGIEPNQWLANWGKKKLSLKIFNIPFEKAKFRKSSFEVVAFWDVLEHLTDPLAALKKANKLLKKDGLIVINYPDIESLSARIFKARWWFVWSGHLYYFSPETISKMLKKAGFKVIETKPHWQTLSLFYLLTRLGRYHLGLSQILSKLSLSLGIGYFLIPYLAGQRLVIARKR